MFLDLVYSLCSSLLRVAISLAPKPLQSLVVTCLVLHFTLWVLTVCLPDPLVSGDLEEDLVLRPLCSSGSESEYLVELTAQVLEM